MKKTGIWFLFTVHGSLTALRLALISVGWFCSCAAWTDDFSKNPGVWFIFIQPAPFKAQAFVFVAYGILFLGNYGVLFTHLDGHNLIKRRSVIEFVFLQLFELIIAAAAGVCQVVAITKYDEDTKKQSPHAIYERAIVSAAFLFACLLAYAVELGYYAIAYKPKGPVWEPKNVQTIYPSNYPYSSAIYQPYATIPYGPSQYPSSSQPRTSYGISDRHRSAAGDSRFNQLLLRLILVTWSLIDPP